MTEPMSQQRAKTYTVVEAAKLLGIGRNTAYAAIAADTFPCKTLRLGDRIVIPKGDLDRHIAGGATQTAAEHAEADGRWVAAMIEGMIEARIAGIKAELTALEILREGRERR